MTVATAGGKRAASEPEAKSHFEPSLERDLARGLDDAARLELQLESEGRTKDAAKLRKARHTVEGAREQGDETKLRRALDALDELIYDLE